MILFPSVTIFDDSVLFKAIELFEPPTFKLFVYLYHFAVNYEEEGLAFQEEIEHILVQETGLRRFELYDSFIELRTKKWLQALVIFNDSRGEPKDNITYRWFMEINTKGSYEHSAGKHYIEQTEPSSERSKKDIYIAIGTQELSTIDTWQIQKKTKRRTRNQTHWKAIRQKILERDGNKCTECSSTDKLHVHHLTYENEGNEKPEDLITLCHSCHAKKPKRSSMNG
ncbi:MAG: HNH endonuclease [Candidatus Thorarchaeota archaeon]